MKHLDQCPSSSPSRSIMDLDCECVRLSACQEDMRQACIAVVEELHDSSEPYSEAQETLWIALNALREMTYNS